MEQRTADVEDLFRSFAVTDRWCIHSYYTLSPYAPDGSGRLLLAGADLRRGTGEVLILDRAGTVIDCFDSSPLNSSFYHTGHWQTWSPDGRYVYYRRGTLKQSVIVRRQLETGTASLPQQFAEGRP